MNPWKPNMRPGVQEESASPASLAAHAMMVHDTATTKCMLYIGRGTALCRKRHDHNWVTRAIIVKNHNLSTFHTNIS